MNTRIITSFLALGLAQLLPAQSALLGKNLFPEGTFEVFAESKLVPIGWSFPDPNDRPWNAGFRAELVKSEAGGKELRVTNPDFGHTSVKATVDLPPKIDRLRINYRILGKKIVLGPDDPSGNGAGIFVRFYDKSGKGLRGASWVGGMVKATNAEWKDMEQVFNVPADAIRIDFEVIFRSAEGEVRVDDVELVPVLMNE